MPNKDSPNEVAANKELTYVEKAWYTIAIFAFLVVVILIIRVAFNVLLMALAGSLIAIYFHGLGDLIERKTKLFATAQQFFSTSFGVLGDLYIILFLGIFFTASPALYKNGILKLIPSTNKPLAKRY